MLVKQDAKTFLLDFFQVLTKIMRNTFDCGSMHHSAHHAESHNGWTPTQSLKSNSIFVQYE